ncbi:hypothetical protein MMC22_000988 [Lobaria immixta]|nr:hypothetical protein [Lobaria immixta]
MSSQSHYLLYAASPIGLVTAIITVVRLHGTPLMKRIIGRQFETKADVFADVSSVSYGDVGLVYRDDMRCLEQSTSFQKDKEAHCGIYLGVRGDGDSFFNNLQDGFKILEEYRKALSLNSSQMLPWYRCYAKSPLDKLCNDERRAILFQNPNTIYVPTRKESGTTDAYRNTRSVFAPLTALKEQTLTGPACVIALGSGSHSSSIMYLSGPGVDPALSASASSSSFNSMSTHAFWRYVASFICVALNLVIIAIGIRHEEILTSIFMSVGVAGSFLGSWWIARMISAAGSINIISLRRFRVQGMGFFSKEVPHGTGASSTPRCIAISTMSTNSPNVSLVFLAVLLSTVAYISLYLGLRSASWWKPLAILAVVGAGACSRAILIENGKLDNFEDDRKSSDFSSFRKRSALCQHMMEKRYSIPAMINTEFKKPDETSSAGRIKALPENSNWTILNPSGHIDNLLAFISTDGIHDPQARVLFNAYAIASELFSLNLEPRNHEAAELIISDRVYVQSEFLGKNAVWQQRLKLSIPRIGSQTGGQHPSFTYRNLAALLRIWVTEALSGHQRCYVASQASQLSSDVYQVPRTTVNALLLRYSNDNDDNEIKDLQRMVRSDSWSSPETRPSLDYEWTEIWSNKVMLWMAVKILFALKPVGLSHIDFGLGVQREHKEMVWGYTRFIAGLGDSSLIEPACPKDANKLVPWYISRLSAAQLVTPRGEETTVGRFRNILMEEI